MTDTMFTRTDLAEAAEKAGITTDQARTILEAAGVTVQPEKPDLPTEPGTIGITCDGLAAYVDGGGVWRVILANGDWRNANDADAITPARLVPATADPVTLTEDQVGEVWDANKSLCQRSWAAMVAPVRGSIADTVNAVLAQYAAPVEGELIDVGDVRAGDRVWMELDSGDEVIVTVTCVKKSWFESRYHSYSRPNIRSARLLHRDAT